MACGICRLEGHNRRTCPQNPSSKNYGKEIVGKSAAAGGGGEELQSGIFVRSQDEATTHGRITSVAGGKRVTAPTVGWEPDSDDKPTGNAVSQQHNGKHLQKTAVVASTNSSSLPSKNGDGGSDFPASQVPPHQHNTRAQTRGARQRLQQDLQKAGLRREDAAGRPLALHEWQLDGVEWLRCQEVGPDRTWYGGILADEMGLGKTLQMLSLMALSPTPTLLLCKVAGKAVWRKEANDWFSPGTFRIIDWHAEKVPLDKLPLNAVVLCTVETMRSDVLRSGGSTSGYGPTSGPGNTSSKLYRPDPSSALLKIEWGRVVVDEAQCLKNADTMSHQAATVLRSRSRWAVTGTPLENKPEDLLSLLKFLRAEPFCNEAWFHEHVRIASDDADERHADILRPMFAATMRRRTKANLGNTLPAKHLATVTVPFSLAEAVLHEDVTAREPAFLTKLLRSRMAGAALMPESALLEDAVDRLRAEGGLSETSPLKDLVSYAGKRDIPLPGVKTEGGDPAKVFQALVSALAWRMADKKKLLTCSSKWRALRDLLENIWRGGHEADFSTPPLYAGDVWQWDTEAKETFAMDTDASTKVVIFSQWPTRAFELAEVMLADMGVRHARIDSHVAEDDREKAISRFQNDLGVKVLLVGLKSGGASINLQVAQVAVLLDAWWNPAVEQQAIDRVHRVGSTHSHNYFFKLVASETGEAGVLDAQARKLGMYQELLASVAADSIIDLPAGPGRRH
eukprot:jgi/Mesvir1/12640/Mv02195-RA.1